MKERMIDMSKRQLFCLTAMFLLLSALFSGCGAQHSSDHDVSFAVRDDLFGTVISITIHDDAPESLLDLSFDAIEDIDIRMSVNRADSELSRLNANTSGTYAVSPDLFALLDNALTYSARTNGTFDASIGAVSALWTAQGVFAVRPSDDDISEKLPLVGFEQITLSDDGRTVYMPAGMRIDLGAIAKGHAADLVRDMLEEHGVRHAILYFGGDIYAVGTRPDGSNWRIAITSPHLGDNDFAAIVEVSDAAVFTSGNYERFFEQNGVHYHHILDPKTGFPADSGLISVTVISASGITADALSTAGFIWGLEEGVRLLERLDGIEGIFITSDNRVYTTTGIRDAVTIASPAFTLGER